MALTTALDMYQYFLDGIKKEYTGVVRPEVFNRLINEWGQLPWLKSIAGASELSQKQIDDLAMLHPVPEVLAGVNNVFDLTSLSQTYYRLLGVSFKVTYGANNPCGLTGVSSWLRGHIMRSDRRSMIRESSFRKPSYKKVYYTHHEMELVTECGDTDTVTSALVEYLRYPNDIEYNHTTPANSVDPEFSPSQNQEIADMAIKSYLERVTDPRYKSYLNELAMKASGNI